MPRRHFIQEERPKPLCTGCSKCGDCREDGLYALAPDEKYYCADHFFERARRWPKPKGKIMVTNPRGNVGPGKTHRDEEVIDDEWVEEVSSDLEGAGGSA